MLNREGKKKLIHRYEILWIEATPIFAIEIVIRDLIRSARFTPAGFRFGHQLIEDTRLECPDCLTNRSVSFPITETNDL